MKKILSCIISAGILIYICSCAMAENIRITNTEIKSDNIPENAAIIATLYDSRDLLTGVRIYKAGELARYAEDMADDMQGSHTIKVFVWDLETITAIGKVYGGRLENLPQEEEVSSAVLIVGGKEFRVALEDNKTAASFKALLPLAMNMNELNGNEKYFYLDRTLPADSYRPGTINAGDVMLFGSNCVVIFYKTFSSSYSYTKIGHITDVSGLEDALGKTDIEVECR